jgi:hypothetical protein
MQLARFYQARCSFQGSLNRRRRADRSVGAQVQWASLHGSAAAGFDVIDQLQNALFPL